MSQNNNGGGTYARAGVNIEAGERVVANVAAAAAATYPALARQRARLLAGVGGFAAAVALPPNLRAPVLLAATDGVGGKLELARMHGALASVGQDLVAMCVNDLLCMGAQPLFFLDYMACNKLQDNEAATVLGGIAAACKAAKCALVGGETAEMPLIYAPGKFDLAGFAVGVAEESALLRPQETLRRGDALVAIASNGAHSNGFALIHNILQNAPELAQKKLEDKTILELLLRPTRLYGDAAAALQDKSVALRGLAHITGGGLAENLRRIFPPHLRANFAPPPLPPLFAALQAAGGVSEAEMRRVFNCGIGMVAAVGAHGADAAVCLLKRAGERAFILGRVEEAEEAQG